MLKLEHIQKSFGRQEVLKDVSLEVKTGEIVSILGPSGTGKTTLLRCINYLERADKGKIIIDDISTDCQHVSRKDILNICRNSGMVFQTYNLFKNKTVLENVMEGLRIVKKMPLKQAKALAYEQLERVGMKEFAEKYPSQISGGQQQRAAIARAIALSPSIILFDEPTSALDPELSKEVLNTIKKIAEDGITMIIVTHEINFALEISDRIVLMENGYIVEEGSPKKLLQKPEKERTKQFFAQQLPVDFQI